MKLHSIPVDGEIEIRQVDAPPTPEALRTFFNSPIEYVSVLYQGQPTTMVVDEVGAVTYGERGPLPVNPRATEIYHAASKARGQTPDDTWPSIHGPALLVEGWWHKQDI